MKYDIMVIGDWHLSYVTAAVLSNFHDVALVSYKKSGKLPKSGIFPKCPVNEPGINEWVFGKLGRIAKIGLKIDHYDSLESNVSAKWIWLAIDTPVNENDEPDTTVLLETINYIAANHKNINGLIISSQVPITFCDSVEKMTGLKVAYIPENLRLGKGVETFFHADRTVIGSSNIKLSKKVQALLQSFETEFLLCSLKEAEMIKHATNAFLATSISFANELARIGEAYDVDGNVVAKGLKLDKRIGQGAYVAPGLGFAGGTLPRDLQVLTKLGKENNIKTPLIDAVLAVNKNTSDAICDIIYKRLKEVNGKSVLIMGYTYKKDTNTLRRSLSVELAEKLLDYNYDVFGYDPVMNYENLKDFPDGFQHLVTLEPCDVIVVMTGRDEFKNINWKQFSWQKHTLLLDTQNIIDENMVPFIFKRLWGPIKNK